ncbi:caspase family protein [Desulfococcaceae bacterium HSG9]|nr:caspase family protein [Desulfococcaceae bacterium HSG9]
MKASAKPKIRTVAPAVLDDYDILDDEINTWLAALERKTDQVIFVSDSCHSGTVTRNEDAPMSRGIPIDTRPHPLGTATFKSSPLTCVRISACQANEKAVEYPEAPKTHGLFTWFWAQALKEARPGETWDDLHKRVSARLRMENGRQHPQIEGKSQRLIFKGGFAELQKTIPVRYVYPKTPKAKIGAGRLLGVTRGSVYQKYDAKAQNQNSAVITITKVGTTWSEGDVQGTFVTGDLVTLKRYKPAAPPLKVFIAADLVKDRPLVERIKAAVAELPMFAVTPHQEQCKYVLRILRPKQTDGKYIYARPDDSAPRTCTGQPPQCWVMTSGEGLVHKDLITAMRDADKGIKVLCENLEKMGRLYNLTTLTSAPGPDSPVQFDAEVWRKADPGTQAQTLKADNRTWQKEQTVKSTELAQADLRAGRMLTFTLRNNTDRPYYTYLVNMTDRGEIIPFYPPAYLNSESGLLPPGGVRHIEEVTLFIETPGREYIRLIASLKPIDIFLLTQDGYRQGIKTRSEGLNPLEMLLVTKAGHTRSRVGELSERTAWSTMQGAFEIKP